MRSPSPGSLGPFYGTLDGSVQLGLDSSATVTKTHIMIATATVSPRFSFHKSHRHVLPHEPSKTRIFKFRKSHIGEVVGDVSMEKILKNFF